MANFLALFCIIITIISYKQNLFLSDFLYLRDYSVVEDFIVENEAIFTTFDRRYLRCSGIGNAINSPVVMAFRNIVSFVIAPLVLLHKKSN